MGLETATKGSTADWLRSVSGQGSGENDSPTVTFLSCIWRAEACKTLRSLTSGSNELTPSQEEPGRACWDGTKREKRRGGIVETPKIGGLHAFQVDVKLNKWETLLGICDRKMEI
jgi:hypothetical protein